MLTSSFPIGRVRGIRIQIHISWLIIFLLLTLTMIASLNQTHPQWIQATVITTTLASVVLFFASIVLHELGHSLVAQSRGIPVSRIMLFVFGGMAQIDQDAKTARDEFWIAVAGPLVSLALAVVFLLLARLLPANEPAVTVFGWVGTINLVVAIFNLIPGFPLDGGRVFRAIVWGVTGDPGKAMRWAVTAGRLVAYGLLVLGVYLLLAQGLWSGLWMMAIAWFLLSAATASGLDFSMRQATRDVLARDLMEPEPPRVTADTTLEQWVNGQVLPRGYRAALVTHSEEPVGLVTLSDASRVPRERWAETPVDQAMTPKRELHTVAPTTPMDDVLHLITRRKLNQLPVMAEGRVIGWISRERVLQSLQVRMELERTGKARAPFIKPTNQSR